MDRRARRVLELLAEAERVERIAGYRVFEVAAGEREVLHDGNVFATRAEAEIAASRHKARYGLPAEVQEVERVTEPDEPEGRSQAESEPVELAGGMDPHGTCNDPGPAGRLMVPGRLHWQGPQ